MLPIPPSTIKKSVLRFERDELFEVIHDNYPDRIEEMAVHDEPCPICYGSGCPDSEGELETECDECGGFGTVGPGVTAERRWRARNGKRFARLEDIERELNRLSGTVGSSSALFNMEVGSEAEIAWLLGCELITPKMPYPEFLQSWYWRWIRSEIIPARSKRCERCGKSQGYGILQLHHLTYEFRGHERLHPEILEVLCDPCHGIVHDLPF